MGDETVLSVWVRLWCYIFFCLLPLCTVFEFNNFMCIPALGVQNLSSTIILWRLRKDMVRRWGWGKWQWTSVGATSCLTGSQTQTDTIILDTPHVRQLFYYLPQCYGFHFIVLWQIDVMWTEAQVPLLSPHLTADASGVKRHLVLIRQVSFAGKILKIFLYLTFLG